MKKNDWYVVIYKIFLVIPLALIIFGTTNIIDSKGNNSQNNGLLALTIGLIALLALVSAGFKFKIFKSKKL